MGVGEEEGTVDSRKFLPPAPLPIPISIGICSLKSTGTSLSFTCSLSWCSLPLRGREAVSPTLPHQLPQSSSPNFSSLSLSSSPTHPSLINFLLLSRRSLCRESILSLTPRHSRFQLSMAWSSSRSIPTHGGWEYTEGEEEVKWRSSSVRTTVSTARRERRRWRRSDSFRRRSSSLLRGLVSLDCGCLKERVRTDHRFLSLNPVSVQQRLWRVRQLLLGGAAIVRIPSHIITHTS